MLSMAALLSSFVRQGTPICVDAIYATLLQLTSGCKVSYVNSFGVYEGALCVVSYCTNI